MRRFLDGFRLQILALIILPLSVLLLAFSIIGVRIHQDAMRRLVAERDERSVRAAAAAISQQIHHGEAALRALALRVADGTSPEIVLEETSFLDVDFDQGLGILNTDHHVLASTGDSQDWIPLIPASSIAALDDGEVVFDELSIGANGEEVLVVQARSDGWIAVGGISIDQLMRLATLGPGSRSDAVRTILTDERGRLLVRVGSSAFGEDSLAHPGVEAALRGETGSSYLPTEYGEQVVAFTTVSPTGWALVIEEPWEAVASPVLDLSLTAPLALVPVVLVTIIALWFGSRQVITPLRQLEQKADSLASGAQDAIDEPVGGIAEIQRLQETLSFMTQRVHAAQDALRGYINTMTTAQEDERRRLARELHDDTIQDLIALGQKAQVIALKLRDSGADDLHELRDLQHSIQEAIDKVRRLSRGLRPIYLEDLGLITALEMLAKDVGAEHGFSVDFTSNGEVRRLGSEVELALYRIAQEALSNVSRHAEARHASISTEFARDQIRLIIADDGVGFQPPNQTSDLAREGHYGLIGMQERAVLIGARLDVQSEPGRGTQITITLPLREHTQ